MASPEENPIGFLQEFCVKHKDTCMPKYFDEGMSGPDHLKSFSCKCSFNGYEVIGLGPSKKQAKTDASKKMIKLLAENKIFERYNIPSVGYLTDANTTSTNKIVKGQEAISFSGLSKNPVGRLQEYCQQNHMPMPKYIEGGSISGSFLYECCIGNNKTHGLSISKKSAKAEAAFKMCKIFNLYCPDEVDRSEQEVNENLTSKLESLSISNNFSSSSNYISMLQEYCASKRFLQLPLYKEEDLDKDMFCVSCTVGNVRHIGRNPSKKNAKQLAAMAVYNELQEKNGRSVAERTMPDLSTKSLAVNGSRAQLDEVNGKNLKPIATLDEFSLSEDEEEDNGSNVPKITLESLNLNDSVVEIEPNSNADSRNDKRTETKIDVIEEKIIPLPAVPNGDKQS